MLLRVSAQIPFRGTLLGFLGTRFSRFRKRVSSFSRVDDNTVYQLKCRDDDPLARGELTAQMDSISKDRPKSTVFANIQKATEFVFNFDGSCGYSFQQNKLSFQKVGYPQWDMYFCHECDYQFPILEHVIDSLQIDTDLDCVLFMQNTPQTWCSSWLYRDNVA